MNNWDYPAGADTKDAPWNQEPDYKDPVEVEIDVTVTLGKTATVTSENYNATPWYDEEVDEDGYVKKSGGTDYEFFDLYEDYGNCEYSVIQLLGMLRKYVQRDLDNGDFSMHKKCELKDILTSADGWEEVETDIEEA